MDRSQRGHFVAHVDFVRPPDHLACMEWLARRASGDRRGVHGAAPARRPRSAPSDNGHYV